MKLIWILVIASLLYGCSEALDEPLTPFQCRVTGVDVPDDAEVTGEILSVSYYEEMEDLKIACKKPFSMVEYGCAIPVNVDQYEIHVLLVPVVPQPPYNTIENHERCHAGYQTRKHVR